MNHSKFFFILFLCLNCAYAAENGDYDEEAADSLKIEANHDLNRLKSFKSEMNNNKIFENEREKALGEFLEEQEKWDLLRERGLRDYRKQKKEYASPTENSPEYQEYLKQAAKIQLDYEKSRISLVKTRDKIAKSKNPEIAKLETDELQLYTLRPRYELRKRGRNKWVASGNKSGLGGGSSSGGYVPPPLPISNDYPPSSDFPAAPAPYEGFEELPPPPVYDSNMNSGVPYDPSFSGDMSIPPPPPPPPDYDF